MFFDYPHSYFLHLQEKNGKSAGKGWDFMKRPEMTDAVKMDLELLQMRGVLNPKQRFKTSTMKVSSSKVERFLLCIAYGTSPFFKLCIFV